MIQVFLITSLFIFGLKASLQEGMIFEKIGHLLDDFFYAKQRRFAIARPLYDCVACMASVYGTISYWWVLYPYNESSFVVYTLNWIIWVFALSGFNYIISKQINK